MAKPTPWKDQYTLLCNRCGYIIESLYADSNCPECGHPIEKSIPTDRAGTPWQLHQQSMIALIKTWFMTIGKPGKVIDTMKFDHENGKSMAAHTPLVAVVLALISIVPMAYFDGIGTVAFLVIGGGLIGLVFWFMACLYSRIAVTRLTRSARKKNYKFDLGLSWSVAGHASSYWIWIPFGLSMALWTLLLNHYAGQNNWIDPYSKTSSLIDFTGLLILTASAPISISMFELFLWKASRRLRYTNQVARPLFSSDTQQLLTKPVAADSIESP